MARKVLLAATALGLCALSGAVSASSDGGCYPSWKLFDKDRHCASRAMLSPSNDTRVNLLFLTRGASGIGAYPAPGWNDEDFGRVFLDWGLVRTALIPTVTGDSEVSNDYAGSRCFSLASGKAAFVAALASNRGPTTAERTLLADARRKLEQTCADPSAAAVSPRVTLSAISTPAGQAFQNYLLASDAFYAGRWDDARGGFAALVSARDPWVAETAAYMSARVDLNAAIANAFDDYGYFQGPKSVDKAAIGRAGSALAAYLKAWPQGRYAASAQGLQRRILWLSADTQRLSREYERLLGTVGRNDAMAAALVEEIDNKFLYPQGEASGAAAQGAMLLAIQDLAAMRDGRSAEGSGEGPSLSASALAVQQATFAGQPDLWSFLQASHAFHVGKDMKRVLQLIPDDARQPAYSSLAYSRQMLRGMALAALGDPNEAGFWRELMGGATGLWQRPGIELALAMNYERHGKLAQVFAKNSPITDSNIRNILLEHAAGPDILRTQALDSTRPLDERRTALFTLLNKQLSRGDYAGFAASRRIAVPVPTEETVAWDKTELLASFASGKWSDGYACPVLAQTASTLANSPANVPARLCLGDFWRLNGFDYFDQYGRKMAKDELGGAPSLYPGARLTRGAIYDGVIADPRAAAPDKAYALYRAVMCYAPGGTSECGTDVPKTQRRAWFQQLKRDFPASPWARRLQYFW